MTLIFYIIIDLLALFFMELGIKSRNYNIKNNESGKEFIVPLFISFMLLSLVVGFRSINVGVDTKSYALAYQRIVSNTMTNSDILWLGAGYVVLGKIIGFFFGSNYVMFNLIIGMFSIFFLFLGILKNSRIPTLSLFIFICMCLYYQMFNQARQMFALSIIIYSYSFLINRNFRKYLITILVASSIHNSALIMLPYYYILNCNINKKNMLIYILITLIIIFFSKYIINFISLYTTYGDIYSNTGYFKSSDTGILNLIVRVIMLLGSLFFMNRLMQNNDNSRFLYNLIIWCTILQIIASQISIFSRVTTYFYVFYILLIPEILQTIKYKNIRKIAIIFVICLFITYHFVYYSKVAINSGYNHYDICILEIELNFL